MQHALTFCCMDTVGNSEHRRSNTSSTVCMLFACPSHVSTNPMPRWQIMHSIADALEKEDEEERRGEERRGEEKSQTWCVHRNA